jgi:hypothetical protein
MRKLLFVLSFILAVSIVSACAEIKQPAETPTYTYEGDFNPEEFMNWQVIASQRYFESGYFFTQLMLRNPNELSPVKTMLAIFMYTEQWTLISYAYTDTEHDYVYILDLETNSYKLFNKQPSQIKGV